jgi:midasin (ATPase involved in ribosome maturation)
MLTFECILGIKKEVEQVKQETYTDEEIEQVTHELLEHFNKLMFMFQEGEVITEYTINPVRVKLVKPTRPLSDIHINLPAMRAAIVDQMKDTEEMELPEFLMLVRRVFKSA